MKDFHLFANGKWHSQESDWAGLVGLCFIEWTFDMHGEMKWIKDVNYFV